MPGVVQRSAVKARESELEPPGPVAVSVPVLEPALQNATRQEVSLIAWTSVGWLPANDHEVESIGPPELTM